MTVTSKEEEGVRLALIRGHLHRPCLFAPQGGIEIQPTVIDADGVLGYFDLDHFLGGEVKLDRYCNPAKSPPIGYAS
jgi:hypothetical protein